MVDPKYQGLGIGKTIMNKLVEKVDEIRLINKDLRVYLGAVSGKEDFYRKFGFISRNDAGLGEGMILNKIL